MTFSALRTAYGVTTRRALGFGDTMPSIVGSVTTGFGTGARTVTPPVGSEGDLILLGMSKRSSGLFAQTAGESFNEVVSLGDATPTTTAAAWIGWRFRTASDTTYTFSADNWNAYVCYAITGANPSNPIADFSVISPASGGSIEIPAVSSDRTNCLLFHFLAAANGLSGGWNTPPGGDEISDHWDAQGGSSGTEHRTAHEPHPNGGGTGTRTWGNLASQEGRVASLVLVQPDLAIPSFLELEGSSDVVLLEDGAGNLVLEN